MKPTKETLAADFAAFIDGADLGNGDARSRRALALIEHLAMFDYPYRAEHGTGDPRYVLVLGQIGGMANLALTKGPK